MARCPNCGSENCYGLSRVVGYFSAIHNWNGSKQAELRDRQKGNYAVPQVYYKRGMRDNGHNGKCDERGQAHKEAVENCQTV
jgi:hypothetical protein